MPARQRQTGISLIRHVAPLAPVAIALAMQTSQHAGGHRPSAGVSAAAGVGSFQPICTLPFAGVRNGAFDDQCGIDGGSSDPAKQAESRAKNNFCAATQTPREITYDYIVGLQAQSKNVAKKLNDRSMLTKLGEGDYVSYIAYIKDAHYSDVANGEAVNCNIPGNDTNDIHIILMKDPDDDDECNSTTAEMSPHYRPPDWTPENLKGTAGHPIRIQGQLFYDGSHTPCSGSSRPTPNRISLWEIHPVYSIDVCSGTTIEECQSDGAEWTPLSKTVSTEEE